MSTELVRRAKVLRLCKEILGNEARQLDMEELIQAFEGQGSHIEGLLRQEETLKLALNPKSNLVPFPNRNERSQITPRIKIFEKRFVVNTPCLIEGSTAFDRKKLAFEIHSRTSRSIFIDLNEVQSLWNSNLLGLEDATVFTPNVEALNDSQQDQLIESLSSTQPPLIIAATDLGYGELKSRETIKSELLNILSQAHFRLQRPVKEYLELGFFKLFLESLS